MPAGTKLLSMIENYPSTHTHTHTHTLYTHILFISPHFPARIACKPRSYFRSQSPYSIVLNLRFGGWMNWNQTLFMRFCLSLTPTARPKLGPSICSSKGSAINHQEMRGFELISLIFVDNMYTRAILRNIEMHRFINVKPISSPNLWSHGHFVESSRSRHDLVVSSRTCLKF